MNALSCLAVAIRGAPRQVVSLQKKNELFHGIGKEVKREWKNLFLRKFKAFFHHSNGNYFGIEWTTMKFLIPCHDITFTSFAYVWNTNGKFCWREQLFWLHTNYNKYRLFMLLKMPITKLIINWSWWGKWKNFIGIINECYVDFSSNLMFFPTFLNVIMFIIVATFV